MRAALFLMLLMTTALAGCGDKVSYPDDFMLKPDDAPSGLLLLKPGMEGWDAYTENTGATANPSSIDPQFVADVLGTPVPTDAHGAVYVTLSGGFLVSAVVGLPDNDEAKTWLRDQILDSCLSGIRLLMKDDHLAVIGAAGVAQEDVNKAAKAVKKASKSDDLCKDAFALAIDGASALELGENGPFTMEKDRWFHMSLNQDATMQFSLDASASARFSIHDASMGSYFDATGTELTTQPRLEEGTYFLRVAPSSHDAGRSFTLSMSEA